MYTAVVDLYTAEYYKCVVEICGDWNMKQPVLGVLCLILGNVLGELWKVDYICNKGFRDRHAILRYRFKGFVITYLE